MAEDLVIDLTNYKDRTGSRVPPGTYRVQVEDAEVTTASSGNTMINVFLRIMGGEFDGQTLLDRLVLTEKSMFRVVGFMQGIGLPTPRKRLKVSTRNFIGKVLDVQVDDGEAYQGRIRSEIRGYLKVAKDEQPEVTDLEDPEDSASEDEDEDEEVTSDKVEDLDEVDLESVEV